MPEGISRTDQTHLQNFHNQALLAQDHQGKSFSWITVKAPRAMLAIVQGLISSCASWSQDLALAHDNGFAGMQNARVRVSWSFTPTFHRKPGT